MPRITFINSAGDTHIVEGDVGQSVMEVARRNGIEGIVAECGGSCACATCHVYVDKDWVAVVGAPTGDETDMLDFVFDRHPESRLSCQIRIIPTFDGLIVRTPERQN